METSIQIAVIGGTGKSGTYLLKQLLLRGFRVHLLVRNPAAVLPHPLLTVIHGDVQDPPSIRALLKECTAVISMLGMGQPASPTNVFSVSTANILHAMREAGMRRYLVITGLNVDTPQDNKSPQTQFATDWMRQNYPQTTADKQLEYELLAESDLDWTLVRLPMIRQTDDSGPIAVSLEDCPSDGISATSLAGFLLEQLSDETYFRKAPFLANA